MFNGLLMRKTPLTVAVSIATLGCTNAYAFADDDVKVLRSLSLVSQPAVASPDMRDGAVTYAPKRVGQSSLFHNDLARKINSYPGMFAVNTIINGQNPTIINNSSPSQGAVMVVQDDQSVRPLPYLDHSLLSISRSTREVYKFEQPDISALPSGLVGGLALENAEIIERSLLDVSVGSDRLTDINIEYGHEEGDWGHVFQFSHQQVDSYRQARESIDGDMKANDILIKIAEKGNMLRTANQQLTEFTIGYSEYENDESRFGIATQDINDNADLRYSATALDNEKTENLKFGLNHNVALATGEIVKTQAYYADGQASFYQTASVNELEGANAATFLSNFERAPSSTAVIAKDALTRDYSSGGIKITMHESFGEHSAALGVNYHTETVNDNYHSDVYQLNSDLSLSLVNAEVDAQQSETSLNSKSIFLTDHWRSGPLAVKAAIKHEWLSREQTQNQSDKVSTDSRHTIGNISLDYTLNNTMALFLSAQEGLLPSNNWLLPSQPQTSRNIRAGLNYQQQDTAFSVVAFNNDFYNVFSRCYTFSQCSSVNGESHDINIRGLELTANYVVDLVDGSIPVSFAYTYRDHEYSSDQQLPQLNFSAMAGDELAFIPKNQLFLQVGYKTEQWNIGMQASYRGAQRRYAGSIDLASADSLNDVTLIDFSASYQLDSRQSIVATLNNFTDQQYVESAFNGTNLMAQGRSIVIDYQMVF